MSARHPRVWKLNFKAKSYVIEGKVAGNEIFPYRLYLDLLFAETQGTVVYLGEWHTHPERSVEPSGPDTRMLADILTTGNIPTGFAIGIIVDSKKSLLIWKQTLNDINPTNPEIFIL